MNGQRHRLGNAKLRTKSPPLRPGRLPGRHRDEFLAVDHVDRGRREDPGAGVELPQRFAGLGVIRVEVSGDVAAAAHEHDAAGGDDRSRLAEAFEHPLPHQFARRRVERREVAFGGTCAGIRGLVDGGDIKQPGLRAVGNRAVVRTAARTGR